MPSVRIRKTPSTYLLLPTRFDNDIEASSSRSITVRGQRSMGSLPRPTNAQIVSAPGNKQRLRSHTTSGAFESVSRPPINRGRSGSRSKVVEHVLASRRPSVSSPSLSHHGSPAVDDHGTIRDRLQVSQTDISTHSQPGVRAPGIVESALEPQQSQQLDESIIHDDIVDHLDAIGIAGFLSALGYTVLMPPDPQVAIVSSLANAANSILIPPLSFYSRKPVIALFYPSGRQGRDMEFAGHAQIEFDGMDELLDRHVEDVLTGRSKVKRTLQGVWSFLKTPIGIITGIYGFLVVFWGAALVLFLLKWINLHNANTQGFWVEVCSQVVCGLFTVTGIGLIPARALDTYRICKVWHYKHKTTKLRDKAGLPQLFDVDDLPDPAYDPSFVHVLTEREQQDLHHQQVKFHESQTWYRPHGTVTHRAFPINTALWICLFIDGNSAFQVMLSSCMWSMNRFERPAWTTGSLIPASFLCGIIAAILIWRGGKLTRRTEKIENTLRTALAMDQYDGLLHVPTTNISTNYPSELPGQTSTAGTHDLHASSEKRDNSGAICAPPAVSPIVEEMMIK
ncbi:hypothetical protein DFJ58DRAFT_724013 [Suillus subalutaceus]|uniref:uncharacterized protein n=1 Tax=Suillus subalutaceus TaxID=48586 RepID=UPI001B86ADEC|nr:uncharacterized protein DFJ58DRAFT_724013 [Suillus subalutaceus]KAG1866516.1 hypothetical protein DFJ58DRAFT_724013 [Suillus subalutaceus]